MNLVKLLVAVLQRQLPFGDESVFLVTAKAFPLLRCVDWRPPASFEDNISESIKLSALSVSHHGLLEYRLAYPEFIHRSLRIWVFFPVVVDPRGCVVIEHTMGGT